MARDPSFETLYGFQDRALALMGEIDTEFYLTGGTAASRGYLEHRYSEDLDLFVNDDSRFGLWADRIGNGLAACEEWTTEIALRDERFVRLFLVRPNLSLKVEMEALGGAQSKAAGLFPADVARVLLSARRSDWDLVRWIEAPDPSVFLDQVKHLAEHLLLLPNVAE